MTSGTFLLDLDSLQADSSTKQMIECIGERILRRAPSDSNIYIALRSVAEDFTGYCRIVSCTGMFLARALGTKPIDVSIEIESQILKQIFAWRNTRFNATSGDLQVAKTA